MTDRLDALLGAADSALRTIFARPRASRACPTVPADETTLDAAARREAGALMRVNHVGEVCAQALYSAQALATRDPALRQHFGQAAEEETDHLAWTRARLDELGARPSALNPLWYAGAFGLGLVFGFCFDTTGALRRTMPPAATTTRREPVVEDADRPIAREPDSERETVHS
jgi:ubiquinone biosynthesis monooxygenase Coq7